MAGVGGAKPIQGSDRTSELGRNQDSEGSTFRTELQDGQLSLKKSTPGANPMVQVQESQKISGIASNVHPIPDAEDRAQAVIRDLNAAAKRGEIVFKEEDGVVRVIFNNSGSNK